MPPAAHTVANGLTRQRASGPVARKGIASCLEMLAITSTLALNSGLLGVLCSPPPGGGIVSLRDVPAPEVHAVLHASAGVAVILLG